LGINYVAALGGYGRDKYINFYMLMGKFSKKKQEYKILQNMHLDLEKDH